MKRISFSILIFFTSPILIAHQGMDHSKSKSDPSGHMGLDSELSKIDYGDFNEAYLEKIKPIFQKKCLDCHGTGNPKPWYYVIPGPKQLMDLDIKEAKEHMDMSNDFPFGGHGSPVEDLESLEKMLNEDSMPPLKYKIMHWSSSLTEEEKSKIKGWVRDALRDLKKRESHH